MKNALKMGLLSVFCVSFLTQCSLVSATRSVSNKIGSYLPTLGGKEQSCEGNFCFSEQKRQQALSNRRRPGEQAAAVVPAQVMPQALPSRQILAPQIPPTQAVATPPVSRPSLVAPPPAAPQAPNVSQVTGKPMPTIGEQRKDMQQLPVELYSILQELEAEGQLPQGALKASELPKRYINNGEDFTDLVKEGKIKPHEVSPEWTNDMPDDPIGHIKQQAGW